MLKNNSYFKNYTLEFIKVNNEDSEHCCRRRWRYVKCKNIVKIYSLFKQI